MRRRAMPVLFISLGADSVISSTGSQQMQPERKLIRVQPHLSRILALFPMIQSFLILSTPGLPCRFGFKFEAAKHGELLPGKSVNDDSPLPWLHGRPVST